MTRIPLINLKLSQEGWKVQGNDTSLGGSISLWQHGRSLALFKHDRAGPGDETERTLVSHSLCIDFRLSLILSQA